MKERETPNEPRRTRTLRPGRRQPRKVMCWGTSCYRTGNCPRRAKGKKSLSQRNLLNSQRVPHASTRIRWAVGSVIFLILARGLAPAQESADSQKGKPPSPIVQFIDIGEQAGLTAPTIFRRVDTKKYILDTTGTAVPIFDYHNNPWPTIFIVNGTTLERFPPDKATTNHLYHNNHDG